MSIVLLMPPLVNVDGNTGMLWNEVLPDISSQWSSCWCCMRTGTSWRLITDSSRTHHRLITDSSQTQHRLITDSSQRKKCLQRTFVLSFFIRGWSQMTLCILGKRQCCRLIVDWSLLAVFYTAKPMTTLQSGHPWPPIIITSIIRWRDKINWAENLRSLHGLLNLVFILLFRHQLHFKVWTFILLLFRP